MIVMVLPGCPQMGGDTFGKIEGRWFAGAGRQNGLDLGEVVLPVEQLCNRAEIVIAAKKHESRESLETESPLQCAFGCLLDQGWREAATKRLHQLGNDDGCVIALDQAIDIAGKEQQRMFVGIEKGVQIGLSDEGESVPLDQRINEGRRHRRYPFGMAAVDS